MNLRLGAATYTYLYATDLEQAIDRLAALGFASCELMMAPPHLSPDTADSRRRSALRGRLERQGLELLAVQPGYLDLNISSTNPRIRDEAVHHLCDYINLAADLGARFFVLGTGRRHPLIPAPLDWLYPQVVKAVATCVREAERRDILITVENIPTHLTERADSLRALCDEIGSDACQIVYDVANGHMVEDPAEGLRAVAPYLRYVHLSDTGRERWEHKRIGQGDVDFAAVTRALESLEYDGPAILEVLDPELPDEALDHSAERLAELGWRR
jgi:L-ribulose-5-phosphate 3-epimerase